LNNAKEAEVIVKNLRNKKNGSRTTIKPLNLQMNYNLLMNFIRKENSLQRSLTSSTKLLKTILKPLSLRTCFDEDTLSAVLQITGAGGTESCSDWASMLMRMMGRKVPIKSKN
jgi:peptide chain release factor 2